jgi:ATP-dependent helicase/nuclease subunit B
VAPEIRALGDLDAADADVLSPLDELDLPPALAPEQRRGALARLVQAWRSAQSAPPLPPSSALAAADELAGLIDQAALAGDVDWTQLTGLSLSTDLAEHWRLSAEFLRIVAEHWPAYLAETGAMDAQRRRRLAAERLAARWADTPLPHPVVVAGSTGSAAASRILMRAVLALPKGLVALPGLDLDIDPAGWKLVARAPSHPQHALHAALRAIGRQPEDVRPWPGAPETSDQRARRRLVNLALAPAEATGGWNERLAALARPGSAADLVRRGLSGVRLIETEDESEEALVAALLLREILEQANRTAALVTPDARLAHRVAAILGRWSLDIAPSAGAPLLATPPGSLLVLAARWALDPADPVLLLALLKHPLTGLGWTAAALDARVRALEAHMLRGPRRWTDLAALQARAAVDEAPAPAIELLDQLARIHADTTSPLLGRHLLGADVEALSDLALRLCASGDDPDGLRLYGGRAGQLAAQMLEQMARLVDALGGVPCDRLPDLAETLAREIMTPPDAPEHPRIAIWGPLEARLQSRDRMILASLNEGSWPRLPSADSLLNRRLRREVGLPDPDERIGLSAHDFAQLASAPELVLLRARRVDDKPAVASRWLWRLRTLAGGGLGDRNLAETLLKPHDAADPVRWARALRSPPLSPPMKPPEPRPPVALRKLTRFSPSRVGRLIRDPYSDFAERVLGLRALRRPGEPLDALARGTAVHAAIEAYARSANPSSGLLERLLVDRLTEAGADADIIELERPLWLAAAEALLRWQAGRAAKVRRVELESQASIQIPAPHGDIELLAKADRVELLADGTLAIIDFKSGAPKTAPQVQSGLEPQLPLEAAIAARAAFGGVGPAETSEMIYFQLGTARAALKDGNGKPLAFKDAGPMDVAEAALNGLLGLVERYADPGQPYLSKPRVLNIKLPADYDRLARREEWANEEGEE